MCTRTSARARRCVLNNHSTYSIFFVHTLTAGMDPSPANNICMRLSSRHGEYRPSPIGRHGVWDLCGTLATHEELVVATARRKKESAVHPLPTGADHPIPRTHPGSAATLIGTPSRQIPHTPLSRVTCLEAMSSSLRPMLKLFGGGQAPGTTTGPSSVAYCELGFAHG